MVFIQFKFTLKEVFTVKNNLWAQSKLASFILTTTVINIYPYVTTQNNCSWGELRKIYKTELKKLSYSKRRKLPATRRVNLVFLGCNLAGCNNEYSHHLHQSLNHFQDNN